MAWMDNGDEMDIPFLDTDLVPRGWLPKDFADTRWELDTEMVLAAWVFYNFARGYWAKYRY
jgi:hypothetical protein